MLSMESDPYNQGNSQTKEMDLYFVLFKAMGFYTKPILPLICFFFHYRLLFICM